MNKVIVIGSPGAGKSTFARELRDRTGLPLYYLDMIWHKADRTNISVDELKEHLKEIIQKDCWIIDGNYSRTLPMRLEACDTVFLLDYPLEVCLQGIQERVGTEREEMPWTEDELDPEFRQFVIDFPQNRLPRIYELLNEYRDKRNIIVFHSRPEAREFLTALNHN